MKIIYLDQFAVSNLTDSITSDWVKIKDLLKILVRKRQIICPLSLGHYLESAARNPIAAKKNDVLLNQLSNRKCFNTEPKITVKLIVSLLRNEEVKNDTYLAKSVKNYFNKRHNIKKFRENHKYWTSLIKEPVEFSNLINSSSNKPNIKKPIDSSFFKTLRVLESNCFKNRVFEVFRDESILIRPVVLSEHTIPNWIDMQIHYLMSEYKMKKVELLKLHKELENNGFQNIPTLDIRSNLEALQKVLYKNGSINNEIDNMRIACSLPISDLLITDNARKNEIEMLDLNTKYNCEVLSGKKNDIEKIISYLEKI